MKTRKITVEDSTVLYNLAKQCPPLLVNSPYINIFLAKYFSDTCFVLEDSGQAIGFVTAMRSSENPDILFLWQLGLQDSYRNKGLSRMLLKAVAKAAFELGCRFLQFSIAPENSRSLDAFSSFADSHKLSFRKTDDYKYCNPLSNREGHEVFYEIKLDKL